MKAVRDTCLFFGRYGRQMLRNLVWVFVGLSTPLLYLALFTPLLRHLSGPGGFGGHEVLDQFLPGILALTAFGNGMVLGFWVVFALQGGVIERFRVTPVSRLSILLGPILFATVAMFVSDIVFVGVGVGFGFSLHLVGLAVLAMLLGLLMVTVSAFSSALALVTKDINSFAAVINGLNLPVLLLGGVLLPISFGPLWLRVLAHFDPLYYVVAASRILAAGTLAATVVWQAFAVLVPLCMLTLVWATRVVRRAVA